MTDEHRDTTVAGVIGELVRPNTGGL